jgi:hypothetical protein
MFFCFQNFNLEYLLKKGCNNKGSLVLTDLGGLFLKQLMFILLLNLSIIMYYYEVISLRTETVNVFLSNETKSLWLCTEDTFLPFQEQYILDLNDSS